MGAATKTAACAVLLWISSTELHQLLDGGRSCFAIEIARYMGIVRSLVPFERFGPSTGGEALSPKEGVFVLRRRPSKPLLLKFNEKNAACLLLSIFFAEFA